MNKIFDLVNQYGIRNYCKVTCTSELLYSIEFRYKNYYTTFCFLEHEFDNPTTFYYINNIIANLADIVKAF